MAKVLLIEDDAIVQHVHKLMFSKLGHDIEIADSGFAALALLRTSTAYNIIFADIGLPDMKGFDLIQTIRKEFFTLPQFPIIALTGYIGDYEKNACFAAGATTVIHKPILMNKMIEILNQYLT